ncbi:Dipeptide and tripeptide permease A [invertebrate metagenome]|uniref:Dipeptide and tripeptide permease A n=1 Tax=invertebrate metagenome TaxID=1711999 RepID=A0A2H9T9W3_9ZZZZ
MIVWIGYQGNFFLSAGIMSVNMLLFFIFRKELIAAGNTIDRHFIGLQTWMAFVIGSCLALGSLYWLFSHLETGKYVIYSIGVLAIAYFILEICRASAAYRFKMGSVLIVIFILMVFYFYYGQMNTSMNIYAINLMDDQLLGFIPFRPESSSAFNPLWCCLLGSPLVFAYQWLEKRGVSPSIPSKFSVAFVFSAVAFFLLGLSARYIGENGKIAAEWIVVVHLFQAIAELIVGALGAGYIFEMVPRHLSAFAIGVKSVALSLSSLVAAVISTKIALPERHAITPEAMSAIYSEYFLNLAVVAVIMAGITLALSRVITCLVKKGENLEANQQMKQAKAY